MGYRYEVELSSYIKRRFHNQQFKCYEELLFYERRIDIVAHCHRSNTVVSVEMKLTRWLKALQQALIYQLCSDFVYVAMPGSMFTNIDREMFVRRGVGFIGVYRSHCRQLIRPVRSKVVRDFHKNVLVGSLELSV